MNLHQANKFIKEKLKNYYPDREISSFIRIIFEDIFKISKIKQISEPNTILNNSDISKLEELIIRLQNSEPLQYIVGFTYFYESKFVVNKNVLIPRNETEELVDLIVKSNKLNTNKLKILDIGTGSGCIAISLSKYIKNSEITAIDISEKALQVAKTNSILNNVNVNFIESDILQTQTFSQKFDIIVSNPPYVRISEKKLMRKNVLDYEPYNALFVEDNNPLIFYSAIIEFAKLNLNEKGMLYFEINEYLGKETVELVRNNNFYKIELIKDINRRDRFISAELCKQ